MDMVKGQVVQSRAGRDVTKAYVVVGFAKDRVLVADGIKWTRNAPKAKNPRHLNPTKTVLQDIETDLKLITSLRAYISAQETNV